MLGAPVLGFLDAGAGDDDRLGDVDDDARAVGSGKARLERLDQADRRSLGLLGQAQFGLRHLHDNPVRVGQREDLEFGRLRQTDDEAGALLIA